MAKPPAGKKSAPPSKKTPTKPAATKKAAGKAAPASKAPAPKKPTKAPAPAKAPAPSKKPAKVAAAGKHPGGAPSKYTHQLMLDICEHIANCVPLRAIAGMEGMPSVQTMMTWLADEAKPEFLEHYARAREAQADKLAEDILAIADEECTMVKADKHGTPDDDGFGNTEVVFDSTAVQRNKLRVDARKWLASKMAPKKYGDKLLAEHTGANGGAIQVASTVTFVRAKPRPEDEE